ncbi:MAG: hypothetical protein U9R49_14720, partial [Bacteroidota bacterium]|nr:hypothetical protein [Bacteroidota bacterium]
MKKRKLLLLQLILPALLCSGIFAQPNIYMIDLFPELVASISEEGASLFSVEVNGSTVYSRGFEAGAEDAFTHRELNLQVIVSDMVPDTDTEQEYGCRIIRFINRSDDTLELENLIPLGDSDTRPYITGYGPPGLARATLFRPGHGPVGLIVPDNAWE